jgi:uncharacterized membrane protein YdjX (TVP38/TMEM64 family)
MRLLLLFFGLAAVILIPFLIWGDQTTAFFGDAAPQWIQSWGPWGWLAAIGILISDLFLPIPSTAFLSALGFVYGALWGGFLGFLGSFLSGSLAYGLCRKLGDRAALKILGEQDLERGKRLFANLGGWIIALTRWLPILPEVSCCLAGLTRMPPGKFFLSLACGTLPMALSFAWLGSQGKEHPALALGLSAAIPVLFWGIATWILHRKRTRD